MSTENLFCFESYQCNIGALKFYKNGIIFDPDITGISLSAWNWWNWPQRARFHTMNHVHWRCLCYDNDSVCLSDGRGDLNLSLHESSCVVFEIIWFAEATSVLFILLHSINMGKFTLNPCVLHLSCIFTASACCIGNIHGFTSSDAV